MSECPELKSGIVRDNHACRQTWQIMAHFGTKLCGTPQCIRAGPILLDDQTWSGCTMFRDEKLISGFTCSGHGPADSLPQWWLLYIVELQVPYTCHFKLAVVVFLAAVLAILWQSGSSCPIQSVCSNSDVEFHRPGSSRWSLQCFFRFLAFLSDLTLNEEKPDFYSIPIRVRSLGMSSTHTAKMQTCTPSVSLPKTMEIRLTMVNIVQTNITHRIQNTVYHIGVFSNLRNHDILKIVYCIVHIVLSVILYTVR